MSEPKQPRLKPQPWWSGLLTLVPREHYLKAVRLAETRANLLRSKEEVVKAQDDVIEDQKGLIRSYQAERSQIRSVLLSIPVFEDLVGPAPLPDLVAQIARDHEELEARIEAVLDVILTRHQVDAIDMESDEWQTLNRITGLLQGQIPRVPDTPEGLTDDG